MAVSCRPSGSFSELPEASGEEVALHSVLGEQLRLLVGRSSLGGAAEATQEVGARCHPAVARELRFGGERVECLNAGDDG